MRTGRLVFRILLAGALSGVMYFAWVSSVGSPSPVDLLPAGAFGVVEVRSAEDLAKQLEGTRFAAAFARSATRDVLERTAVVKAFDSVLSEVERISGVSPGRGSAFDLLGAEAAIGWYAPASGDTTAVPWVAGGRLSARAWTAATAMRLASNFGLGTSGVTRREIAGRMLYSLPGDVGQALHVFLVGRVLVGGSDLALVEKAARTAGDADAGVTREPAWLAVRGALPAHGELFAWVRDQSTIPGTVPSGRTGHGSVGGLLRTGKTTEIDVAAEPASMRPAAERAGVAPTALPKIALLRQASLFSLTSREPVPSVIAALLQNRLRMVERRNPVTSAPAAAIEPGGGWAVAITDSSGGSGFFPTPRGVVVIGMASADAATRALPLLFPSGARTATAGGTRALATRESIPFAGEFELWGAAVGPQLVFATDTSLIDAAAADIGAGATRHPEDPPWTVNASATISVEKVLPLLRRWAAPLAGVVAASWPGAPDIARDLGLLAAVGTVRATIGSDARFDRAAITFDVHDIR